MRVKDVAAVLVLLVVGTACAVSVQGRASLFQREAPARSEADAREALLADVRRLEALGCSAQNLEAALRAWDVPAIEASRRASDAYAASRVGARCGGSVVLIPTTTATPAPEIPHQ